MVFRELKKSGAEVISSVPLLICVRQVLIERLVLSYLYVRRSNAVSGVSPLIVELEFFSDEIEVS